METHTAAVYFAGDRVFKVKKPVAFDFVDLSTPAARRKACEAEVTLNRRLAPDVYLGVADITVAGEQVEHAVVMRRLPATSSLAARIRAGEKHLSRFVCDVADVLAAFHTRCPVVGTDLPRDLVPAPIQLWRTETERMHRLAGDESSRTKLQRAYRLAEAYAAGRTGLFNDRLDAGFVRDGHGDLLASDVYLLADGPRLLDCLEFDPRLRAGDVLHDAAFLAMDLEHLGRSDLARMFIDRYCARTGDHHPATLAHFYVAHRALIRAKVATLRAMQVSRQPDPDTGSLLDLCLRHAEAAQVRLVLLGGLPGSGKTTAAAALAEQLRGPHLSSDRIRYELTGASHMAPAFGVGRYAAAVTGRVYREMLRRAEVALRGGEHVVLDASWSSAQHRTTAQRLAREVDATLVQVLAQTDDTVAARRMASRQPVPGGSEATVAVREEMRKRFDPWPDATNVRTDATAAAAVDAVTHAVEERSST